MRRSIEPPPSSAVFVPLFLFSRQHPVGKQEAIRGGRPKTS